MARWIVDGMNVIGSRPDGWWRDRRGAMERLVRELESLDGEVAVVFDGKPFEIDKRPGRRGLRHPQRAERRRR